MKDQYTDLYRFLHKDPVCTAEKINYVVILGISARLVIPRYVKVVSLNFMIKLRNILEFVIYKGTRSGIRTHAGITHWILRPTP